MDTSISKALIMVASVLLAMIVIAFITFSFRRMGQWAITSDDELLTKQKDKFNKEYEVYDKDLMYGVDVISCLNKALSNNDKISKKEYVTGDMLDQSYEIKVKVSLKNKMLEESLKVYHIDEVSKKESAYENDAGPIKTGTQKYKLSDMEKKFSFLDKPYESISNFGQTTELKTQNVQCNNLKNVSELNITSNENGTNEEETRKLLSLSDTISEIIKNPDKTESSRKDGWTKAEFRSALYDLKTRKFKCIKLTYSEAGRVNYIEFKEI